MPEYGSIETVSLSFVNPQLSGLWHDAVIVIVFTYPISKEIMTRLGDDAYGWLKRRVKRIRRGRRVKRRR